LKCDSYRAERSAKAIVTVSTSANDPIMSWGLRNKVAARSRGVRICVRELLARVPEFMVRVADDYDGGI
jgi:hypothetical protein